MEAQWVNSMKCLFPFPLSLTVPSPSLTHLQSLSDAPPSLLPPRALPAATLTQEEHVGSAVGDELDEGLLEELSLVGVGGEHVGHRQHGKHGGELDHLHQLADHVLAAEPWQTIVPDGAEELLHVGVSHELKGEEEEGVRGEVNCVLWCGVSFFFLGIKRER